MSDSATGDTIKVLLYSDDRTTRAQVRAALGRRVGADLPDLEVFDVATPAAVLRSMDEARYDLLVLDGEAVPHGGMGLAHQLKDEIVDCPPVVLLVARQADAWLATWSRAEAVSSYPIDPIRLPAVVAEVLRATRQATQSSLSS